jgi:pimeloyl-ACP methyl ester carboxylesterase
MAANEQTVTLDDGATTTLEWWGDRGPAVICVHGITSSRKSWERTAAALRDSYRVFAYDQRGHGDCAGVAGPMTLRQSVDDLRAVARTVGQPAALIGHSWGGAVAVLGGREQFAGKVLAIDPMLKVPPGTWRFDYLDDAEALLALTPADREASLRRTLGGWNEIDVAGKLHAVRNMRAQTIARLGGENNVDEGEWDLRDAVADYPKPLLILAAGPSDSVMSPEDLAYMQAHGGANVGLVVFEDQGHNLHRTAFERYLEAVKAFLAQT